MIHFTIDKQSHKLKTSWDDFTLEQAIAVRAVELPDVDDWFTWYEYLDKLRELLTHFTTADTMKLPPTWIVSWSLKYALPIKRDLHSDAPVTYQPRMIDSFEHEGVKYYMPDNLYIFDDIVLQHSQNAQAFVEASNLLKAYSQMSRNGLAAMSNFIACVVKQDKREPFNEAVITQRAETFKTLPMPIVWEVFFCTSELLYKRMTDTLQFSDNRKQTHAQRLEKWLTIRYGLMLLRKAELLERLKQLTN